VKPGQHRLSGRGWWPPSSYRRIHDTRPRAEILCSLGAVQLGCEVGTDGQVRQPGYRSGVEPA